MKECRRKNVIIRVPRNLLITAQSWAKIGFSSDSTTLMFISLLDEVNLNKTNVIDISNCINNENHL